MVNMQISSPVCPARDLRGRDEAIGEDSTILRKVASVVPSYYDSSSIDYPSPKDY